MLHRFTLGFTFLDLIMLCASFEYALSLALAFGVQQGSPPLFGEMVEGEWECAD